MIVKKLLFLLIVWLVIAFIFSLFYYILRNDIKWTDRTERNVPPDYIHALYYSFNIQSLLGNGENYPTSHSTRILIMLQVFLMVGILFLSVSSVAVEHQLW